MPHRNTLLTEFTVRVFADGQVDWDGADEFLWCILHEKAPRRLGKIADKIARFGIRRAVRGRPKSTNKKR
jgi:hypothetical protein